MSDMALIQSSPLHPTDSFSKANPTFRSVLFATKHLEVTLAEISAIKNAGKRHYSNGGVHARIVGVKITDNSEDGVHPNHISEDGNRDLRQSCVSDVKQHYCHGVENVSNAPDYGKTV